MKLVDQMKQHSNVIAAFFAGATSAITAGYIYCKLVHRKGGKCLLQEVTPVSETNQS